ncbi:MAG: hypothetical protein LBU30_05665 [Candidatus Methanoplasma sp.]|jgi:cytoplasmic iron level regulating protein YaaA (DUF328/UPF0246 family)|nr:hypothetical protein [Candidatus Methanoplasma sp.]
MYISQLFRGAYRYAKKLNADRVFILSAKYGLLEEYDSIEPYNETLNNKTAAEVKKWADGVLVSLAEKTDLQNDEFVFLAGEKYRKYLVGHLQHVDVPLLGMRIGEQLAFYKENA